MKPGVLSRLVVLVTLATLGLVGAPSAQAAATVSVTTQNDAVNASDGVCSLREAVTAANSNNASGVVLGECPSGLRGGTITVPGGTYAVSGGELHITGPVTINGAVGQTTVVSNGTDRLFEVDSGVTASISGLEIANGQARGGGGVLNHGNLTLTDDVIDNNSTPDENFNSSTGVSAANGGGLDNEGTASLTRVQVLNNFTGHGNGALGSGTDFAGSGGAGGGIYNGGTMTLTDSQVTDNHTGDGGVGVITGGWGGAGGGIANGGTLTASGDTIERNLTGNGSYTQYGDGAPGGPGGGIAAYGTVNISGSTISSNHTGSTNLLSGVTPKAGGIGAGIGADDTSGVQGSTAPAAITSITVTSTTIADNTRGPDQGADATGIADGIDIKTGGAATVSVADSAVTGNGGFGIAAWSTGYAPDPTTLLQLSLRDVTIANSASGGLDATTYSNSTSPSLTANVAHTTIAANGGPAIRTVAQGSPTPAAPAVTTTDSLFAADNACTGTINDGGHNLSFQTASCPGVTADPKLGTLGPHGGTTATIPLQVGSAAIDAIPASDASCTGTDQRGVPRPVGVGCDIGAYEVAAPGISSAAAAATSDTTGRVTAHITSLGTPATVSVRLGTSSAYTSTVDGPTLAAGAVASPVSIPLTGLSAGTTFHAQLVATNEDGTTRTQDLTFTTTKAPGGGSGGNGGGGKPPAAPRLSGLSISPGTFRAAAGRGASIARARPTGATVRYGDTLAATTTFTVQRVQSGHRNSKGQCSTKPVRRGSHAKKCTLVVNVRGSFTHRDKAGRNSFHFTGRLTNARLSAGHYRLIAVARLGGKASRAISHGFSITR